MQLRIQLWSWLGALLILLAAAVVVPPVARADGTVQDVRVQANGDTTRVVVDVSRKVGYRHLTLDEPARLAIDLPDVAFVLPDSLGRKHEGLVKGFRFGRLRPGISRLVLEIEGPFEIVNVFELPANDRYGHRIVTDLRGVDAAHWAAGDTLTGGIENAALVMPPLDPPGAGPKPNGALNGARSAALSGPLHLPPGRKPEPPRQEPPVVVIDPGHGGIDPGAIGASGVYEKNVVLAMGRELRRELQAKGFRVVMTRDDDRTLRLRDRIRIARESRGDLFISLHADSLVQAPQVSGAAVYTLSEEASTAEAARLANKENRADILHGIDLSQQEDIVTQILIDLAQRDANNKSIRVAEVLVDELRGVTKLARSRRQSAGFVVLKSPDMPSVLVELGYLSNPEDERALTDPAAVRRLAGAMVEAVRSFFATEAF